MAKSVRLSANELIEEFLHMYRVPFFLAGISLTSAILGIVLLVKSTHSKGHIQFHEATESASVSVVHSELMIDVSGAVNSPGVYMLNDGARIQHAIEKAGGLSPEADIELLERTVNRAQIVADSMKIYIPKKGRETETVSNPVQTVSSLGESVSGARIISINSASQKELEALNGIGPKTAEKIIAGRPFLSLEELVEKKVLSSSLYEKLKGELGL